MRRVISEESGGAFQVEFQLQSARVAYLAFSLRFDTPDKTFEPSDLELVAESVRIRRCEFGRLEFRSRVHAISATRNPLTLYPAQPWLPPSSNDDCVGRIELLK